MTSQRTLADRYVLESEIARGGMGVVWRARDEVLARTVAVKVLHEHLSLDDAFLERFRREALAAARLAHPNIVAIYDTGADAGEDGVSRQFIVMEHCGGGTLETLIAGGPVAPAHVAAIGRGICEALDFAHRHDVVHRDIKPANVLITEDGTLKVADFGIAKAAFVSSDITTTGAILGTVAYLSPEQAQGEDPDARSDVYSLGVLLYELLTGRPPFVGETQIATALKHMRVDPMPPRSIRAGIPKALEGVIMRALAKDPNERFGSARDMGLALERAQTGEVTGMIETGVVEAPAPRSASPARSSPSTTPSPRTDLRWVLPVAAVVAVAALLAFTLPRLVGADDPPGEDRPRGGRNGGRAQALEVARVDDFDPHGDDLSEHPDEVTLAADENESTAWSTSSYNDPLTDIKPGVGLLFDLGEAVEVDRVELTGEVGDWELRYADAPGGDESDFQLASAPGTGRVALDEPVEARYWLVWITELPNSTGSASISEVEFFGP